MLLTEASNGPSRNLLRGDAGDLAGLELVEFTLGLLELGLLGVAVELRVEAGDQALGEPGALLGRELKGLRLDLSRRGIHDRGGCRRPDARTTQQLSVFCP
jgi:hypothetical protein